MITKNLINLFNISNLLLILLYIHILNAFLTEINIRKKFLLLITNLFVIVGIGLYYSLDGLVMMFFISELTVILIFIVLFSQLYTQNKEKSMFNKTPIISLVIIFLNLSYRVTDLIEYKSFYNFYNISLNDFFYIYNTYFEKQILLTIFIIFAITLYSIFFILVYYTLREKIAHESKKIKNIFLLRKQNIIHQNNYNTNLRIFKTKY